MLVHKNGLLVTEIQEPFTREKYTTVIRSLPLVNAYYEAAYACLISRKPLVEEYSVHKMYQEKYIFDYMMQNEYRYLLRSMHIIHLPMTCSGSSAGNTPGIRKVPFFSTT